MYIIIEGIIQKDGLVTERHEDQSQRSCLFSGRVSLSYRLSFERLEDHHLLKMIFQVCFIILVVKTTFVFDWKKTIDLLMYWLMIPIVRSF
jgi:hypothetical protein